jgi:ABC-type transport system involved in cytochrome bd biosynthesis fused ATPase/permease subunit
MYTLRSQVEAELDVLAVTVPVVALFPGLAAITQAPAYWGPKGAIGYVVGLALFLFVMRWKVLPRMAAWGERVQAEQAELAATLGRQPTPEELTAYRRR